MGCLALTQMSAQHKSVLVMPLSDSLSLGSNLVLRDSISFSTIKGKPLSVDFHLSGINPRYLVFTKPPSDSLLLSYYSIPFLLPPRFSLRDSNQILAPARRGKPLQQEDLFSLSQQDFKPFKGLSSQGSISRGFSLGNNQDAVLNSALNLQLSGDIGKNTQIRASISDNTVPVQAEGYTAQLREFDRVYLELENPDFGLLRAGDYNIISQDDYFLSYDKRISGGGVETVIKSGENQVPLKVQGGLARGRFTRNTFQGQEGNQGPYKLRGANNEQFIIIISGSERVYIDGVLQQRGEQNQYIMDYNAGEISFTALQPITRDKRIVVEFQYTEQNFLRTVFQVQSGFQSKSYKTKIHYYNESDQENQPLIGEYSQAELERLAAVGDNLEGALISSLIPSEYNPASIQYRLVDSLANDSVLVFSRDSTSQLYSASFSFLGNNKGDYRLTENQANGRVFQWVAPLNGLPQGSYAPVKRLIAPNSLEVLSWQNEVQISPQQVLKLDGALSRNVINSYSDRDRNNDIGLAGKLLYKYNVPLKKAQLSFNAAYEFNNPQFTSLERIRAVEFARDWNLPLNYSGAVQLLSLNSNYSRDSLQLQYNFQALESPIKSGYRHLVLADLVTKRQLLKSNLSLTQSTSLVSTENFWREQIDYRYFLNEKWWLGVQSTGELNISQALASDSVLANSYSFIEYRGFSGWGDTAKSFVEIGYLQRFDDSVRTAQLERFTQAQTWSARANWKTKFDANFQMAVYYRQLQILQGDNLGNLQNSLTTRFNYNQRLWRKVIISNSFYESGAGNEPRRSFTYIEVPAGTGTFTHTDYNENGIRELDEFEIAPTPDLATFIRVFSPNVDFVRTSIVKLGQNLNINTPQKWQQGKAFPKALSHFSTVLAYQLDRRNLLTGNINDLDPFASLAGDTLLVALNQSFRQTVFFNRGSARFGADYTIRQSDNRSLVTYGLEQRAINEQILNMRYTFAKNFIFRLRANSALKNNRSGNFTNRNFDIDQQQLLNSLTYQLATKFSLALSYQYKLEQSDGEIENDLSSHDLGLELNYTAAQKLTALAQLNYIQNNFDGLVNSPAAYEMLQALRPGENATFNLSLQRTFLNNIVLSLSYNGRYSASLPAIHTGNIQVKAFF
jgi:hypothetical protein